MTAQRVAADVAYTQRLAKTTSTSQTMVLTLSPAGYSVPGASALDGSGSYSVNLLSDPYQASISSVSFAASTISFDRFGRPASGGTIVLQSGSITKTISVDADTGAVTIQ